MAKEESVTDALLEEVERNVEQMTELSLAFSRAAAAAWTQGLRATVDAISAAVDEVSPKKGTKRSSREQVERIGRGVRDLAQRASVSYGDALREGSSRYLQEVERVIAKGRSAAKAKKPASKKVAGKPGAKKAAKRPSRGAKA